MEEIKNIILELFGFIILVYGTKTDDAITTIFGLAIVFIDVKIKSNKLESELKDLNNRLDNYKDIMRLNQEVKEIKNKLGDING